MIDPDIYTIDSEVTLLPELKLLTLLISVEFVISEVVLSFAKICSMM